MDVTRLIKEIHLVNRAWKIVKDLTDDCHPLSFSLRERKSWLQARLLREFPQRAWLRLDETHEGEEAVFGVILDPLLAPLIDGRTDADHLPVRKAEQIFTPSELQQLVKN